MTASKPLHDESTTLPHGAHLDSTAHLMNRITSQLADQLSLVSRDGRRRPEPALVLVAHGSRDPRTLRTVTALVDRVRELRPGLPVRLGHIELNEPLLPDTLAALGTSEAVLVPLLLSRGYHVKRDIPDMAATAPARTRVATALGPHPLLVDALHDRLIEAGWRKGAEKTGVVLAAAGSRDPDAATDTGRTAQLLADRLGVPVIPAYASAAKPTVQEAVQALTSRGCRRVAVASYFTAPGYFATQCAEAAPWIASAPLGTHPAMARLVLHRYDEALTTQADWTYLRGAGNCATSHPQPALAR
ncbi:sirohydrochlorin chelatase [Streptomyces sp. DG2A-72]|uniref:sirohydrochlorin chelatase n=1 Tax=Streptomyces sp. DG2A-72 TaxID=3051386 RepID=UPI00265C6E32|nr:sirohydrochlorin chelatase [Streptomyces sp. DG2A-72]MDO0932930.1 sirohydrochlorin chelatase [Streptomyces sp. DG2A-72]